MLRRLSVIWVICFGLLAISGPVVACALASAKSDCCPQGGQPCGESGAGSAVTADVSACCFTAPAPGLAAPIEASRVRAAPNPQTGDPNPPLRLVWALTLHRSESIPIPVSYAARNRADNASLTYLRTLRLRL
jgi:hypothetical protein